MGKELMSILLLISALVLLVVGCSKPVTLSVWEPKDGATITESTVEVKGYVSDDKATVWVNDRIVPVTKAKAFSTAIILIEGENTINVVAARGKEGKWKDVVDRTVTVTYTPKA